MVRFTTTTLSLATSLVLLASGCSSQLVSDADAASGLGSCATLVIADPATSLDGYTRFLPDDKRNNPSAGDPSYVYLHAGTEAVVIAGPDVANASGLFTLMYPGIALDGADVVPDGYTVRVNSQLGYGVAIEDFEYEVALARVEMCEVNQVIQSRFVFAANPTASGVAHNIGITATGVPAQSTTAPVTVEVR